MELGLWVEPESFELKSELYRKHPEWAMAYPGCPPFRKRRDDVDRDSVMLNLARRDVAEYLYTSLHTLVAETGIRVSETGYELLCQFARLGGSARMVLD